MRVAAPDDGLTHADLIPLQIAFAKLAVQQTLYGDFMHHRLNAYCYALTRPFIDPKTSSRRRVAKLLRKIS
jgi:hypothetical protein